MISDQVHEALGVQLDRKPPHKGRAARVTGWVPAPIWFLLPGCLLYLLFLVVPTLSVYPVSLFDWTGLGPIDDFVGLGNFAKLVHDAYFGSALLHNVEIYAALVVFTNTVCVFIGALLNRPIRLRYVYRAIIFLPVIFSPVVTGLMWELMLSPTIGIVNPALAALHLGFLQHQWLADPRTALPSMIAVLAWQWNGEASVLFLAGLQGVRRDLQEAAMMDGASALNVWRHVTLPSLAPSFTIVNVLVAIYAFRVFDLIYVLGGPDGAPAGATVVMALEIYDSAFGVGGTTGFTGTNMSYGMTQGIGLFTLLGVFAAALLIYLSRRERKVYD